VPWDRGAGPGIHGGRAPPLLASGFMDGRAHQVRCRGRAFDRSQGTAARHPAIRRPARDSARERRLRALGPAMTFPGHGGPGGPFRVLPPARAGGVGPLCPVRGHCGPATGTGEPGACGYPPGSPLAPLDAARACRATAGTGVISLSRSAGLIRIIRAPTRDVSSCPRVIHRRIVFSEMLSRRAASATVTHGAAGCSVMTRDATRGHPWTRGVSVVQREADRGPGPASRSVRFPSGAGPRPVPGRAVRRG